MKKSPDQFLYKSLTKALALQNNNNINKQYSINLDLNKTRLQDQIGWLPESDIEFCDLQFIPKTKENKTKKKEQNLRVKQATLAFFYIYLSAFISPSILSKKTTEKNMLAKI